MVDVGRLADGSMRAYSSICFFFVREPRYSRGSWRKAAEISGGRG